MDTFEFAPFDIVVKVTGKYFIQDLVHQFAYVPTGTEMLVQANQGTDNQNTECFGATVAVMSTYPQDGTWPSIDEEPEPASNMCLVDNVRNARASTSVPESH